MDKTLHRNGSGYIDKTAGQALQKIVSEEKQKEIDDTAGKMVHIVKLVLDMWGFELAERVKIRHKKSGREYL